MHIHAVNTLEIRVVEEPDVHFEEQLQACVTLCGQAAGCLGYALTRSPNETGVWSLSGWWVSDEALTAHYQDDSLQTLLGFLVAARASLHFALLEQTLHGAGSMSVCLRA